MSAYLVRTYEFYELDHAVLAWLAHSIHLAPSLWHIHQNPFFRSQIVDFQATTLKGDVHMLPVAKQSIQHQVVEANGWTLKVAECPPMGF